MSSALPKKTAAPHGVGTFPVGCKSLARKLEPLGPTEFTASVNDEGELVVEVPESGEHNHWHGIINKECTCYIVSPKGSALMVGDSPNCIEECTVSAIPKESLTEKYWGEVPAGVKFIPAVGPKGMPIIVAPTSVSVTIGELPPIDIDFPETKTWAPTGESIQDPSSPLCGRMIYRCVINGVEDPSVCFYFDTDTKEFLEIPVGSLSQPGVPADKNKSCQVVEGDIVICPGGDDVVMAFADVQAAIVADGAAFPDPLDPAGAPVPYDPANLDHKIFFLTAQSGYCDSDYCKTGVLITQDTACVKEANGDVKVLLQGGTEPVGGSSSDPDPQVAIGETDTIEFPAGSGGKLCYRVSNCPSGGE